MEESEESSPASHHPDLNDEVAALSVKLVQAINNQTTLDDNLVAARQELERAQTMVQTLELENEKYRRDIDQEVLIRKADSDQEISRLQEALAEEKAQRAAIEKGKKTIEQELETLTAALFEEANKVTLLLALPRYFEYPTYLSRWLLLLNSSEKKSKKRMSNSVLRSKTPNPSLRRIKIN